MHLYRGVEVAHFIRLPGLTCTLYTCKKGIYFNSLSILTCYILYAIVEVHTSKCPPPTCTLYPHVEGTLHMTFHLHALCIHVEGTAINAFHLLCTLYTCTVGHTVMCLSTYMHSVYILRCTCVVQCLPPMMHSVYVC